MAAVLALVFLPIVASVGFMAKSGIDDTGSLLAVTMFTAMAIGVLVGALKIARSAEG